MKPVVPARKKGHFFNLMDVVGAVRFLRDEIGGDISIDSAMDRKQRLPWQAFEDI